MKTICPRHIAADSPLSGPWPGHVWFPLLLSLLLLVGCNSESAMPPDGLPTSEPISAGHVLTYIQHDALQDIPAQRELEARMPAREPMDQLMLGLSLATTPDRGAEAPPLLSQALESEALVWDDSGRVLVELLLRRTRAERHAVAAREAADVALASERVKRQELEMTLEALRQIDREMSEDNRE